MTHPNNDLIIEKTAQIVSAHISNAVVLDSRISTLIGEVSAALSQIGLEPEPEDIYEPAVNPRNSVKKDYIVSLIDGKRYKMLKRHLANHNLTPDGYRARYNLAPDYPMTAPAYSERRRELALENKLGRKAK